MNQKDIDDINDDLKIREMDLELEDDIEEYVRDAKWSPEEIKILKEMLGDRLRSDIPIMLIFDEEDNPLKDGHDLMERLWKISTQKSGYSKAYIKSINQVIDTLIVKINQVPVRIGSINPLVAIIAKWRLKIGK